MSSKRPRRRDWKRVLNTETRLRIANKRIDLRNDAMAGAEKLFERLRGRIERVRELCDKAGEDGSVSVKELRRIIGGGE